ncbi:MAG: IS110 family transposase, partial [Candidatus Schekmanbacteria bacterium]|nr:IS110 family transposase [Candidatus Schekmanbacteria bacterium]
DVIVGNAYDMRRRPGKKTDRLDAEWISELLAHGLIAPSFVPPPAIAALRDLTRLRVALVQSRTQAKNRVGKVLEQANIKLGSVASTIFGASGRAMLTALVAGERDPKRLALLARGRLREKIPQLELALSGGFTEHHGAMIRMMLDQIDMLDRQIGEIEARVEELLSDAGEDIERLTTIPGVADTAARAVVGEIGRDMSRFGSANRRASWAGLCPVTTRAEESG